MTGEMEPRPPSTSRRWPRRLGRARSGARRSVPFVAGVIATFLAIALYGIVRPPPAPLTTGDVRNVVASVLASQTPPPARGEQVYAAIQPSIVLIQSTLATPDPSGETSAIGTGVVVNDQGTILTALHVVGDASAVKVPTGFRLS